ncbi:DUF1566 domain-containing protein [Pseudoalteromonas fenneropenaei]|uniref:DUF1566 domain-containing protein n=1 Tax=Pseudoalteromonas fenneropenaei TaxID=1737459 RepID=A0ABV7CDD1_9GAMM
MSKPQKTEDDLYQQAYQELQANEPIAPTWAKALAMAEGDKAKAESAYLRLRVQQLAQQHGVALSDATPKAEPKSQWKIPAIAAVAAVIVAGWWLSTQNVNNSGAAASSAPVKAAKPASAATKAELIDGRYRDNGNGTITDTKTNLTWMRCSLGQQWTGSTCAGVAMEMNWNDALRTAISYSYAGHSDWRVPTVDELDTLVLCPAGRKPSARPGGRYVGDTTGECLGSEYYNPKININAFPDSPASFVWSSTPYIDRPNRAWGTGFQLGSVYFEHEDNPGMIRLVRNGQ